MRNTLAHGHEKYMMDFNLKINRIIKAWEKRWINDNEACYYLLENFVAGANTKLLNNLPESLYAKFAAYIKRTQYDEEFIKLDEIKLVVKELRAITGKTVTKRE